MLIKDEIYNIGQNALVILAIIICTFVVYQILRRLYKILVSVANLCPVFSTLRVCIQEQ